MFSLTRRTRLKIISDSVLFSIKFLGFAVTPIDQVNEFCPLFRAFLGGYFSLIFASSFRLASLGGYFSPLYIYFFLRPAALGRLF